MCILLGVTKFLRTYLTKLGFSFGRSHVRNQGVSRALSVWCSFHVGNDSNGEVLWSACLITYVWWHMKFHLITFRIYHQCVGILPRSLYAILTIRMHPLSYFDLYLKHSPHSSLSIGGRIPCHFVIIVMGGGYLIERGSYQCWKGISKIPYQISIEIDWGWNQRYLFYPKPIYISIYVYECP